MLSDNLAIDEKSENNKSEIKNWADWPTVDHQSAKVKSGKSKEVKGETKTKSTWRVLKRKGEEIKSPVMEQREEKE